MAPSPADLGEPVERPGLEYQQAFDLCAAVVHDCGGSAVLHASSAFYTRELMGRIEALRPAQAVSEGMGPGVDVWAETAGGGGLGAPGRPGAAVAVWAEPEQPAGDRVLDSFMRYLMPGARLCAVTSGWLRWGLQEWKDKGEHPAQRPAGLRRTMGWLRRAGFAVEAVYGFHGPQSLAWGSVGRFAAGLGRADVADRCFGAMRRHYVVGARQAHWAPVALVLARRKQDQA